MGTAIKTTPTGDKVTSDEEMSHKVSHISTPLTHITYPESIRFTKPELPTFNIFGSILSIASLMFIRTNI